MIIEMAIICTGTVCIAYFINRFVKKKEFIWTGKVKDSFAEPLPADEEDEEEIIEEDEEFASVKKKERAEEEEETVEEHRKKEEEE